MPIELETATPISVGATRNGAINCDDDLASGDTLTGTPTAVEDTTSDLTITGVAVNTAALTILGESTAIGRAIQFTVAGGTVANSPYLILVTATSTDGETLKYDVKLSWQ